MEAEAKTYKVAAALTEDEMITLGNVVTQGFINEASKGQASKDYENALSVWKKLIVTAELKYGRDFSRASKTPEERPDDVRA